jgi:hypothetical protein
MWARKGSIGFMVFCMLLVVLCWQTLAGAASTPPTIDDIVGTYSVTDKEVFYNFDQGACGQCHSLPAKENYSLTWRITKTSESTVQVYIDDWDWLFTAYYMNGFLVQSLHDIDGVGVGIALFSGKVSKVKFKGDFGWGQYGLGGENDYCEWDPYTGKMISIDPGFVVGATLASQHDEQAVSVPGEEAAPLAATSPLGINDLPGPYSCSWTSTIYHPTAGTIEKEKLSDLWGITKIDDYTLNITSFWGDVPAHYGTGVLMVGDVDVSGLDTDARFGILLAKGKPGKISLKGKFYSIVGLGTIDDDFEVAKVSCKQYWP